MLRTITFAEHLNESKQKQKRNQVYKDAAGELWVYHRVDRSHGSKKSALGGAWFAKYFDGIRFPTTGSTPSSGLAIDMEVHQVKDMELIADSVSKYEKAKSGIDVSYLGVWKQIQKYVNKISKNPELMWSDPDAEEYWDVEYKVNRMRIFFLRFIKDKDYKRAAYTLVSVWGDADYTGRNAASTMIEASTNEKTLAKAMKIAKVLQKKVDGLATDYSVVRKAFNYNMRYLDKKELALVHAAMKEASKHIAKVNIFKDSTSINIISIEDDEGTSFASGHITGGSSRVKGVVEIGEKKYKLEKVTYSSYSDVHQSYWN